VTVVDILGYRDWAEDVANTVRHNNTGMYVHYHNSIDETCHGVLTFAVGWSDIISDEMISSRTILVVHPSPLPKYRGGSPIQHQMIAGETVSAVTIFKLEVGRKVDAGPIAWQAAFPLSGSLNKVLKSVTRLSVQGINTCIRSHIAGELEFVEQDESIATIFKRRQPWESEISRDEMTTWPAWKLEAKVRSLADPYPNAFITCADGEKLYLKLVSLE
jgi:methionyl-tRNA formyltransferase